MNLNKLNPRKALNKAFLKVKPNRSAIEHFKTQLIWLLDHSNATESEEFHKNLVADFLKKTYYDPHHFINTKGCNDLVIHNGKDAQSTVGVIIEAKKPTNKAEMLKHDNINVKALQELVLYYLRERLTSKNLEVKYVIATNINEWFIFDANLFEKAFAQNKSLVKHFTDFEAGRLTGKTTDFFYKDIAEPAIASLTTDFTYTYFDLRAYEPALRNANQADDAPLIALFKLLAPEHLLKLPFANDSNSLDKSFYTELLHIIGLAETKAGSKKLIERKKAGERQTGALLENAIIQLDSLDKISRLEYPGQFGATHQERLFNVGLELALTWVNRILFLKLLEAQLIAYHKGDRAYAFLNAARVRTYDDLNSLFFQVLARKPEERSADVKQAFANVPYLNSSLFEPTELEHLTLCISNLSDAKTLPICSATVLKDNNGKKRTGELNTLAYLFEFLDAYDFASEGAEDIQEENKSLINASVLGLIFEKINGYKDGSFFTPGFITMYMCREMIRRAIIQKFNARKGWTCQDLDDLYDKIADRQEANAIINSLKICDPAVGSGHFLVSALNEIIAVKSTLKILQDRQGRRLKEYQVEVVNDELIVTDEDGELFEYNPANPESQRIQETLFHEKQTLIENCLFGVDINPNSVKICRLRLWIELLKNAYYLTPPSAPSPIGEGWGEVEGLGTRLETLPNIDINIKCGNSLISRFALDADLKLVLKKQRRSIETYQNAVQTYREATSKAEKRDMERLIADIKSDFRTEIGNNDPKVKRLSKLRGELYTLLNQQVLFAESAQEQKARKQQQDKLEAEISKLSEEIESIKHNQMYANAFEWRFEFPEALNEYGDFVGFDVVIGNPPYGVKPSSSEKNYFKKSFNTQDDIYVQFFELGMRILRVDAIESFITPITWLNGENYFNTRQMIKENATLMLGIILPYNVFVDAYVDTGIFCFKKSHACEDALVHAYNIRDRVDYQVLLKTPFHKLSVNSWTLNHDCSIVLDSFWRELKIKIYDRSDTFESLTTSFRGILAPSESYHTFKIDNRFEPVFTSSFNRYDSPFNQIDFVDYSTIKEGPKEIHAFEGPKLLIRRIVNRQLRIMATYSDGDFAVKKDLYVFKPKDERTGIFSLLAILNSKLISCLLTKGSSSARKDDFTQITLNDIRKIGVPLITGETKKIFDEKVSQILIAKQHDPQADTTALEEEIDRLVYALYGLTAEEIALVEGKER